MEKAKYIINPDTAKVEKVRMALAKNKEKYNEEYCPCLPHKLHTEDSVCPCKEYRETGHCRCGLYIE